MTCDQCSVNLHLPTTTSIGKQSIHWNDTRPMIKRIRFHSMKIIIFSRCYVSEVWKRSIIERWVHPHRRSYSHATDPTNVPMFNTNNKRVINKAIKITIRVRSRSQRVCPTEDFLLRHRSSLRMFLNNRWCIANVSSIDMSPNEVHRAANLIDSSSSNSKNRAAKHTDVRLVPVDRVKRWIDRYLFVTKQVNHRRVLLVRVMAINMNSKEEAIVNKYRMSECIQHVSFIKKDLQRHENKFAVCIRASLLHLFLFLILCLKCCLLILYPFERHFSSSCSSTIHVVAVFSFLPSLWIKKDNKSRLDRSTCSDDQPIHPSIKGSSPTDIWGPYCREKKNNRSKKVLY